MTLNTFKMSTAQLCQITDEQTSLMFAQLKRKVSQTHWVKYLTSFDETTIIINMRLFFYYFCEQFNQTELF